MITVHIIEGKRFKREMFERGSVEFGENRFDRDFRGTKGHATHSNTLCSAANRCSRSLTHLECADTIKQQSGGTIFFSEIPTVRWRHSMKLGYFDCFSGISGDMTLGALLDAGCSVDHLRAELRALEVPGWEISAEKVWKNGMAATYVRVNTEDQSKHRSLSEILEILQKSQLAPEVRERAGAIFTKLGEAEAKVHD